MSNEKFYSLEETRNETLQYFKNDELATKAFVNKYALKNSEGQLFEKTPDDMHKRLAKEFARAESKYPNPISEEEIYNLFKDFKYIVPQGSPMAGVGNNKQVTSLSNCFVIGNEADSYGGICLTDQEQVQLMKRRGGVGHDLSHIRPKSTKVNNSALTSTGVVPFMERFSNSTREVAQDGRRGALLLSIDIKHPDAEDFIDAKMETNKVTGANISVKLSDDFVEAALNDKKFIQQFPLNTDNPKVTQEIDAKKLWNKIIKNAWKSAEPGCLFWDTVIKESVPDCYAEHGFKTISTNPCGEITLSAYDSCRLIAMNLYSYVDNPFTEKAKFNFELFKLHVTIAQRLMDDLIDLEIEKIDAIIKKIKNDPEDERIKRIELEAWKLIKDTTVKGRRTGLGITALGDTIAALGLTYGTDEANKKAEKIQKTLAVTAYKSSCIMAKERGQFSVYDYNKEIDNPFIKRLKNADEELDTLLKTNGRRNISCLTIAPTGTTSMMTQTTSGIEPVFLPVYKRRRKVNPNDKDVKISFVDEVGDSWEEYNVFHHKFITWLEINGYNVDEVKSMNDDERQKIVKKSPYYKATSADVDWIQKIKMQGMLQKYVDHSISVTVNVPEDTSVEIVSKIYEEAWKNGCKGVTIYREGSRSGVLVSNNKKEEDDFKYHNSPKRPKELDADYYVTSAKGKKFAVIVGLYKGHPYEIFAFENPPLNDYCKGKIVKVKRGHYDFICNGEKRIENIQLAAEMVEERAHTIFISMLLRHGAPIEHILNVAKKVDENISSFSSAVRRILSKYMSEQEQSEKCPDCGGSLTREEGCVKCTNGCGYSKCG